MRDNEDGQANAAFELAAGTVAVIAAGFVAVMMLPGAEPVGRAVVTAVTVGFIAAVCTDWRASAGVAVAAMLIFVGFLTHQYGMLTGDPAPWAFTPMIVAAALLGRGYHRLAEGTRIPNPPGFGEDDLPVHQADRTNHVIGATGRRRSVGDAIRGGPRRGQRRAALRSR
jgi:hypothetical protein